MMRSTREQRGRRCGRLCTFSRSCTRWMDEWVMQLDDLREQTLLNSKIGDDRGRPLPRDRIRLRS